MFRVRVEWSRGQETLFLAHLDVARTMERALRRAGLPVSLSQGFNPRPRVAFAAPLPVGVAGRREVLETWLDEPVAGDEMAARLDRALPPGLAVLRARPVPAESPSLMSLVDAARYDVSFVPCEHGDRWERLVVNGALERGLAELMARSDIMMVRSRPGKKDREVNLRPLIEDLAHRGALRFRITARIGSRGNIRPREIPALLSSAVDDELSRVPWSIERLETGRLEAGQFVPAWDL